MLADVPDEVLDPVVALVALRACKVVCLLACLILMLPTTTRRRGLTVGSWTLRRSAHGRRTGEIGQAAARKGMRLLVFVVDLVLHRCWRWTVDRGGPLLKYTFMHRKKGTPERRAGWIMRGNQHALIMTLIPQTPFPFGRCQDRMPNHLRSKDMQFRYIT